MDDAVERIAQSVLYEGFLLWPYQSRKHDDRQRFTIGGLYPRTYARHSNDRSEASFDCLVEGSATEIDVEVHFLHAIRRQVTECGRFVDRAFAGGELLATWDETFERRVVLDGWSSPHALLPFTFDAMRYDERVDDNVTLVRTCEGISGALDCSTVPLEGGCRRVEIRIVNTTPSNAADRNEALRQTLIACNVRVGVRNGAFVSTIDPPRHFHDARYYCHRDGLWPVLVGTPPARNTLLASAMLLQEYPEVEE
ncbi:MAG: hypothetical protein JO199_03870 [Candidatus Eremiobacteraeota bacterium]|nr:hypothetical protein [Candidatus Eremiobacteraeota bacterium]